jgi:flagellar hook-associated protein 3 FlgL
MTRIDTLTNYRNNIDNIKNLIQNVQTSQQQISSGLMASTYSDLDGQGSIASVISFDDVLTKASRYDSTINIVLGRIQSTELAITNIISIYSDMRDKLTIRLSAAGPASRITQSATSALGMLQDNLNVQYERRYIFSGSRINKPAVGNIVTTSNILNNVPSLNYYQGDNVSLQAQISDTLNVAYAVNANDDSFKFGIAAMNKIIASDVANDNAGLLEAATWLQTAMDNLISLQAEVHSNLNMVQAVQDTNSQTTLFFTELKNSLVATDIPTAVVKMESDYTILKASYMTYNKIMGLSLANYMS